MKNLLKIETIVWIVVLNQIYIEDDVHNSPVKKNPIFHMLKRCS